MFANIVRDVVLRRDDYKKDTRAPARAPARAPNTDEVQVSRDATIVKQESSLLVKALPTAKSDLPRTSCMEAGIINEFPAMILIVGRSGSGKSTVCAHICTNPEFYGEFFDQVYLFSPTAEMDDLTKHLDIPKENLVTEPDTDRLNSIIDAQAALIRTKGIKHTASASKVLIIFDDIVSHKRFLDSPAMLKLATMGRHYLISSIINIQSYTKVPRAIRLQANGIILFPSSANEVRLIVDDHTPPRATKKQFRALVDHATSGKHDFLYINAKAPVEQRFRKCFNKYLSIS